MNKNIALIVAIGMFGSLSCLNAQYIDMEAGLARLTAVEGHGVATQTVTIHEDQDDSLFAASSKDATTDSSVVYQQKALAQFSVQSEESALGRLLGEAGTEEWTRVQRVFITWKPAEFSSNPFNTLGHPGFPEETRQSAWPTRQ